MPSKSNALSPALKLQLSPWVISASYHVALAGVIAILIIDPRPKKQSVEISVVEAPKTPSKAISISKPEPKPKTPKQPRAVFGVSRKALTAEPTDTAAPEAKQGNTLAKAPDQETLKPEDADQLPVPTEEYLVTSMPTLAQEVRIPYPPEARQKGIEGPVVMDLLIDETGKVREAKLLQGPDESLSQAALSAVRGFSFKPARIQDRPVAVRIRYAYRFVLER